MENWFDQRGVAILQEIDNNPIFPSMTEASWGIRDGYELHNSTPSDVPSEEPTAEGRLPHIQTVGNDYQLAITRRPLNWDAVHPPGLVLPMAHVHERGFIYDHNTHPAPDKEGPHNVKGE